MISHGHEDHVLGLLSFITARNIARGDHEKPLEIYYPADDRLCNMVRQFIDMRVGERLKYVLTWCPIRAGDEIQLTVPSQRIRSFSMLHQKRAETLGYVITESRTQLKPEFKGKNIPELLASNQVKRSDLSTTYTANLFAYCLDAYNFDSNMIKGAKLAVMDCTFLDHRDRDDPTHFTMREAWELCHRAEVETMVAAHVSPRYSLQDLFDRHTMLTRDFPTGGPTIELLTTRIPKHL